MKRIPLFLLVCLLLTFPISCKPRNHIQIVGSSTVYPFSTSISEFYARRTGFRAPIVEATGSGGGLKLFCNGLGLRTPDVANASRPMKASEFRRCQKNGVTGIIEIQIGVDGIVLANSLEGPQYHLTPEIIYLALARDIPSGNGGIPNPHEYWSDINPDLPGEKIQVLGPPPTSGTRDAFHELAMEAGCESVSHDCDFIEMRSDGAWADSSENDNLIISKLRVGPELMGVFGWSFLDKSRGSIQAATLNGIHPEFEDISEGQYPLSRSLFVYFKKGHIGIIPGLAELLEFTVSDSMISGEYGVLLNKGLISLPPKKLLEMQQRARQLQTMSEPAP